jgi:hypothetical protein
MQLPSKVATIFLYLFFVFIDAESLVPVGGDTVTTSPTLAYNSAKSIYTWSFSLSGDSYSYIVDLNSTELLTARLKVQTKINSDTFTPIKAAGPNYYFGGIQLIEFDQLRSQREPLHR